MSVAWAKVNQCEDRYVEGNRASWKALEDVTDELKEQNQMAWIQAMNNIYNRAEVGSVIKSKISKTGCYLYIM